MRRWTEHQAQEARKTLELEGGGVGSRPVVPGATGRRQAGALQRALWGPRSLWNPPGQSSAAGPGQWCSDDDHCPKTPERPWLAVASKCTSEDQGMNLSCHCQSRWPWASHWPSLLSHEINPQSMNHLSSFLSCPSPLGLSAQPSLSHTLAFSLSLKPSVPGILKRSVIIGLLPTHIPLTQISALWAALTLSEATAQLCLCNPCLPCLSLAHLCTCTVPGTKEHGADFCWSVGGLCAL